MQRAHDQILVRAKWGQRKSKKGKGAPHVRRQWKQDRGRWTGAVKEKILYLERGSERQRSAEAEQRAHREEEDGKTRDESQR